MEKIKGKEIYFSHTVALTSLFTIGQFIITVPFIENLNHFLGFIISFVFGVLFCFLSLKSIETLIKFKFFKIAVSVAAAFALAETFKEFCDFATDVLYEKYFIAVILFSALCLYFGLKRGEDILKFSLLGFIYSFFCLLIFTFLLLENFKIQNISISESFEIDSINSFWEIFLPVYLIGVFNFSVGRTPKRKAVTIGVIIGASGLLLCAFSAILLFGSEFSALIDYPFLKAISTVAIGKLFSRLDAFIYPVFLFCSLLRVTVCIYVIKFCLLNKGT